MIHRRFVCELKFARPQRFFLSASSGPAESAAHLTPRAIKDQTSLKLSPHCSQSRNIELRQPILVLPSVKAGEFIDTI